MPMKKGYKQLCAEAMAEVRTLTVAEALKLVGNPDHVFVDIRDVRELDREGMIPDAFHAPRGMLEFWVDPESPYYKPVFGTGKTFVLYCAGGLRSALATKTVQDMGLATVCHIEGGFSAWRKAGGPIDARHEPGPVKKEYPGNTGS